MASDAVIAGVAGLIGVGVAGGTQASLAWWKDAKVRRASTRLLEDELNRFAHRLADALMDPDVGTRASACGSQSGGELDDGG